MLECGNAGFDPQETWVALKSRSAASRKDSAREVNVVFNHDFLEVANENFNAHSPTARHGDRRERPACPEQRQQ
jgi:hypothetical protein